jgi:zinc transport system permease protein
MNSLDLLAQTLTIQSLTPTQSVSPAIVAALVISLMGGALSVFVVLKRLAFIGQGISHAAFGGVGIAMVLGVHGATTMSSMGQLAIVLAFSVLAALWIAALTKAQKGRTDTAIGVVLSASMALGFLLFTFAGSGHDHDAHAGHDHASHVDHADHSDHSDHADHDHDHAISTQPTQDAHSDEHHIIEEILFGNILDTDWTKASVAMGSSVLILAVVWYIRRRLIFWSFDEPVCDAFGMSSNRTTQIFMVILALAVVMAMQIAGVVLAAAMLVLPGAAALNLSSKLRVVFLFSILIAMSGASLGLMVGLGAGYPVGPSIVLCQSILYLLAILTKAINARLRSV